MKWKTDFFDRVKHDVEPAEIEVNEDKMTCTVKSGNRSATFNIEKTDDDFVYSIKHKLKVIRVWGLDNFIDFINDEVKEGWRKRSFLDGFLNGMIYSPKELKNARESSVSSGLSIFSRLSLCENEVKSAFSDADVKKILKKYNEEYDFLYKNYDRVAGYDEAVDAWDEYIKKDAFKDLVEKLNKARQDIFSSDREIVALLFALDDLGYLAKLEDDDEFATNRRILDRLIRDYKKCEALNQKLRFKTVDGKKVPMNEKEREEYFKFLKKLNNKWKIILPSLDVDMYTPEEIIKKAERLKTESQTHYISESGRQQKEYKIYCPQFNREVEINKMSRDGDEMAQDFMKNRGRVYFSKRDAKEALKKYKGTPFALWLQVGEVDPFTNRIYPC